MATKKRKSYWEKDRSSAKMVMSYQAKAALAKKRKVDKARESMDELADLAEALERNERAEAEPVLRRLPNPSPDIDRPQRTQPIRTQFNIAADGSVHFFFEYKGSVV
jgi:hypothetical protein